MLRSLSLQLQGEPETQLPLTREEDLIKTDDVLDLSEWAVLSRQGWGDTAMLTDVSPGGSVCNLHFILQLISDHKLTEHACPPKLLKKGP